MELSFFSNKWTIKCITIGLLLSPLLQASPLDVTDTAWKKELAQINAELAVLSLELKEERRDALNETMLAQPEMRYNWNQFEDHVKQASKDSKQIIQLKEHIKSLTSRKDALLKTYTQDN